MRQKFNAVQFFTVYGQKCIYFLTRSSVIDDIFLLMIDDIGIFGQNKMTTILMIPVVHVMMLDFVKKMIMMPIVILLIMIMSVKLTVDKLEKDS